MYHVSRPSDFNDALASQLSTDINGTACFVICIGTDDVPAFGIKLASEPQFAYAVTSEQMLSLVSTDLSKANPMKSFFGDIGKGVEIVFKVLQWNTHSSPALPWRRRM